MEGDHKALVAFAGHTGDRAGNWKLTSWSSLCPQALLFRGWCLDPVLSVSSLLSEPGASFCGGLCKLPTADCGLCLIQLEDRPTEKQNANVFLADAASLL